MRIGFVAGRLDRAGSKLIIAPSGAPRGFPGPWRLAAVIRISDAGRTGDPASGPPTVERVAPDDRCPKIGSNTGHGSDRTHH